MHGELSGGNPEGIFTRIPAWFPGHINVKIFEEPFLKISLVDFLKKILYIRVSEGVSGKHAEKTTEGIYERFLFFFK